MKMQYIAIIAGAALAYVNSVTETVIAEINQQITFIFILCEFLGNPAFSNTPSPVNEHRRAPIAHLLPFKQFFVYFPPHAQIIANLRSANQPHQPKSSKFTVARKPYSTIFNINTSTKIKSPNLRRYRSLHLLLHAMMILFYFTKISVPPFDIVAHGVLPYAPRLTWCPFGEGSFS